MYSEEDIYVEADGKVVYFLSKITPDADEAAGTSTVTIPEMSVIHRAMVQNRSAESVAIASGGISGNVIEIVWTSTSGTATSGLDVSGDMLDIIVAGK